MKRTSLYLSIAILYLLTTICIIGIFGAMVSLKYKVEHSYWSINIDKSLRADQKQQMINQLGSEGRQLQIQAYAFAFFALAAFVAATVLIIKRKKILGELKSST